MRLKDIRDSLNFRGIDSIRFVLYNAYRLKEILTSSFKVNKEFNPPTSFIITNGHLKEVEPKPLHRGFDLNRFGDGKEGVAIRKFVSVLIKNFKPEDLVNFFNNLYDLDIDITRKFFFSSSGKSLGYYSPDDNAVVASRQDFLFHELLHMASTILRKDGYLITGFHHQTSPELDEEGNLTSSSIGQFINEGYTEVLARRYFGDLIKTTPGYGLPVVIAERLEVIVGKEKMESLYLRGDLKGLINELLKYMPQENVDLLFKSSDLLMVSKEADLSREEWLGYSDNLFRFLFVAYKNKIDKEGLSEEERYRKLKEYMEGFDPNCIPYFEDLFSNPQYALCQAKEYIVDNRDLDVGRHL